jgi:hypothetical protein
MMSSSNPEVGYYNWNKKWVSTLNKNVRFVELRFKNIEDRNDYIKNSRASRVNKTINTIENNILKNISDLNSQVDARIWGNPGGPHAIKSTSNVSDNDVNHLMTKVGDDLVGWHRTKHTLLLYNPYGDDWGWFAGCTSNKKEVRFVYTCNLGDSIDKTMVAHMNLDQLRKTYGGITLDNPDNYNPFSEQELKQKIENLIDGSSSLNTWGFGKEKYSNLKVSYESRMVIQLDIEVTDGYDSTEWGPLVYMSNRGYRILDKEENYCAMLTSLTRFNDSNPSARSPDWVYPCYDSNYAATSSGGHIMKALSNGEIPEDGGLRVHVWHAYKHNPHNSASGDIRYEDGYGESVKEIQQAIMLAQQLKQKYAQYKSDFEKEFNRLIRSKEYENLLLHEEFLTIGDFGKEVAHINENLLLLNYARNTQNQYVYSAKTYEGVIRFKSYLQEIDSDLFDILKIDKPCGSPGYHHPRCNPNSNQGPCGCWTYSCYLFKEMTFRTDPEQASLEWTNNCNPFTVFSSVQRSGVLLSGSSCFLSKTSSSSLDAVVNNGYEGRIRVKALDINGNELAGVTPEETPFRTASGANTYFLDILVRSEDHFSVKYDNNDWSVNLVRTAPSGEKKTIPVGTVVEYSNLFTVPKLHIEILDARPPFCDWKVHGHASPPSWGRINGVSGLARIAADFSEGIRASAEWGMSSFNIPLQLELCFGVEIFYVVSFEVGGFVGLEFCLGSTPNKFKAGVYAATELNLGVVGGNARIESTTEWLWEDTASLLDAIKDWLNNFIPAGYELPLPRNFPQPTSKKVTSYGSKYGDISTAYEHSESSPNDPNSETKYSIRDDSKLKYPNYMELETKTGNEGFTKLGFGWEFDGGLHPKMNSNHYLPNPPPIPTHLTQPFDIRYKIIQAVAQLFDVPGTEIINPSTGTPYDPPRYYPSLNLSTLMSVFETAETAMSVAGYIPNKLSFGPWAKLGKGAGQKTGFSLDYNGNAKFQIITENTLDTNAVLSDPEADVFSQSIETVKTKTFGVGFTAGFNVSASFKVFFYPSPWVSVYLGAKLSAGFNTSGKWPIKTTTSIEQTDADDLEERLIELMKKGD